VTAVESPEQFAARSRLVRLAQAKPLVLFFLFAYSWSWSLWLIMLAFPDSGDRAACLFNTSSGLGNALSSNLPRRSHEMWIYTLVVLTGGLACGRPFLGKRRISRETSGL
jgi:hypothetical protein